MNFNNGLASQVFANVKYIKICQKKFNVEPQPGMASCFPVL
jgi:hypothetical protein